MLQPQVSLRASRDLQKFSLRDVLHESKLNKIRATCHEDKISARFVFHKFKESGSHTGRRVAKTRACDMSGYHAALYKSSFIGPWYYAALLFSANQRRPCTSCVPPDMSPAATFSTSCNFVLANLCLLQDPLARCTAPHFCHYNMRPPLKYRYLTGGNYSLTGKSNSNTSRPQKTPKS